MSAKKCDVMRKSFIAKNKLYLVPTFLTPGYSSAAFPSFTLPPLPTVIVSLRKENRVREAGKSNLFSSPSAVSAVAALVMDRVSWVDL